MSLKSELAEVIDWLSGLTDENEASAAPREPLPREEWELVRDNLEKAAGHFREAGQQVVEPPAAVSAELAYDLSVEAQALADLAEVMRRRARPKVDKSADELAKELESQVKANKRLTSTVDRLRGELATLAEGSSPGAQAPEPTPDRTPEADPAPQKEKGATRADHVDDGRASVALARNHLFYTTPAEPVVLEFAAELEVLNDLIAGWHRVDRRGA